MIVEWRQIVQWLRGHNFVFFDHQPTSNVDNLYQKHGKNGHFWFTYTPSLIHVVIELPPVKLKPNSLYIDCQKPVRNFKALASKVWICNYEFCWGVVGVYWSLYNVCGGVIWGLLRSLFGIHGGIWRSWIWYQWYLSDNHKYRDHPFKTSAFFRGEGVKNWISLPTRG